MFSLKPSPVGAERDVLLQINNVLMDASTDTIRTRDDARLYVASASLRDWSGTTTVSVVEKAVPALFGLETPEEVMDKHSKGELCVQKRRVNVRGVRRVINSENVILIGGIHISDPCKAPTEDAT